MVNSKDKGVVVTCTIDGYHDTYFFNGSWHLSKDVSKATIYASKDDANQAWTKLWAKRQFRNHCGNVEFKQVR